MATKPAQVIQLPAAAAAAAPRRRSSAVATRARHEVDAVKAKAAAAAKRARAFAASVPGEVVVGGVVGSAVAGLADRKIGAIGPVPASVILGIGAAVVAYSMDGKRGGVMASSVAVGALSPYVYGLGSRVGDMF